MPGGSLRIERHGAGHLAAAGIDAAPGTRLPAPARAALAGQMADSIFRAMAGDAAEGFMRLPPLARSGAARVVFSGGVSEFLAGGAEAVGDLGAELAAALAARAATAGLELLPARQGIRATVVGASQYTVQMSGATVYLDPEHALPLRNLAVIAPALALGDRIEPAAVAGAVAAALARLDLDDGHAPVAVQVPWSGSASYARLAALAKGLVAGLAPVLARGHPLVIVTGADIGGLIGMQCRSEEQVPGPVVSIDGIRLAEFDFIDIGAVLRATGATPVVVKSLLFPTE